VTTTLWAGRLVGGLHPDVLAFTASLDVDRRLLPFDLLATAAHARMLGRQGLIPAETADRICAALAHIELNGHILVPLQNVASLHCTSRCDAQDDWPPRGLFDDEREEPEDDGGG
jgi:argininosuccinate lyase